MTSQMGTRHGDTMPVIPALGRSRQESPPWSTTTRSQPSSSSPPPKEKNIPDNLAISSRNVCLPHGQRMPHQQHGKRPASFPPAVTHKTWDTCYDSNAQTARQKPHNHTRFWELGHWSNSSGHTCKIKPFRKLSAGTIWWSTKWSPPKHRLMWCSTHASQQLSVS